LGVDKEEEKPFMAMPSANSETQKSDANGRRGQQTANSKSLGIAACTALVVGNMVGSGFYLSPSAVAPYGQLAILAWIVMGGGAVCLGLTFARLARATPATGGPYAYTRLGFGDFAGFLVAWGYWISIWASLPVIAVAFTGSLMKLLPGLQGSRAIAVAVTLGAIWLVTLTNLRGVKEAAMLNTIATVAKLVPIFIFLIIVGLNFKPDIFSAASHTAVTTDSGIKDANGNDPKCARKLWHVAAALGRHRSGRAFSHPRRVTDRIWVWHQFAGLDHETKWCGAMDWCMDPAQQWRLDFTSRPSAALMPPVVPSPARPPAREIRNRSPCRPRKNARNSGSRICASAA
jgi:hypothetical protein